MLENAVSSIQRRLWLAEQLDSTGATYNLPLVLRFPGGADEQSLRAALRGLVDRHALLRTKYVDTISGVVAVRLDHFEIPLAHQTCDVTADWKRLVAAATSIPFDLAEAPPVRGLLISDQDGDGLLCLVFHHLMTDGWSFRVLLRDFIAFYDSALSGEPHGLDPLTAGYDDFVAREQELDDQGMFAAGVAYWKERLTGFERLELPADMTRRGTSGLNACEEFDLDPDTTSSLRTLALRTRSAFPNLIVALVHTFLSVQSGQQDITTSVVLNGRTDPAFHGVLGIFTNTIPVRTRVSRELTFRELVRAAHANSAGDFEHQAVPVERVIAAVRPEQLNNGYPFSGVALVHHGEFESSTEAKSLSGVERQHWTNPVSRFDIEFRTAVVDGRLSCVLSYRADLFARETVSRMASRFALMARRLASEPDVPLARMSMVTADELELLASWNDTAVEVPRVSLTELLDVQAQRSPEAEAVVFCGERLSYSELHARADALATVLAERGAGPEKIVGVALPRSVELIVALLAILKTGAAYLPLDIELPDGRLRWMLEEAQPVAVVATAGSAVEVPGSTTVVLAEEIDAAAKAFSPPSITAMTPAYVIYTSGSTGRPKGVVVHHEAIVNRLLWMQHKYQLTAEDRVLQKTPAAFDVSVWEFFWPLIQGATLVVARPGGHRDPSYLAETIRAERITTIHFVPSMLRVFLTEPTAADCTSLRNVICSGEALPPDLQELYYRTLTASLSNLYGPTEAAVDVTSWDCIPGYPTVPIGAPVWNTRAYVLDHHLNPVPIGARGELFLAGTQIALGYLNRPDLTAQRFLPDPYGPPGARMYRTGDIAHWDNTGNLHYHGRTDHQVKIRGFRIELDEISAALTTHPAVHTAVTTTHETTPGDPRITAYIVPHPERTAHLLRLAELEHDPADAELPRHLLPNGATVVGRNKGEIDFLYQEIFEYYEYLRHGIRIQPGDTVVDIGAHIGMFALFAHHQAPGITIYAFEPIPELHHELTLNTTLNSINAHLFNHGIAEHDTTATFTYYPQLSILSGLHAEEAEDHQSVRAYAAHQATDELASLVDDLITERLQDRRQVTCRLRPLSDVIDEHRITAIDLLKIDAEKAELEILNGIRPEHWDIVRQAVVEVHDVDDRADSIATMLEALGFTTTVEAAGTLTGSTLVNIYASREPAGTPQQPARPAPPELATLDQLTEALREHVAALLPDYMVPTHFVHLPALPLSHNGKLDRKALPAPHRGTARNAHDQPTTARQQTLAGLFAAALNLPRIGIHDNFFHHGGHSLLAAQLASTIRTTLGLHISITTVFDHPTVSALADVVEQASSAQAPITPQPRPAVVPLSFAQQRLWFVNQAQEGDPTYNLPTVLRLRGELDHDALEQALNDVIQRHEVLRTVFPIDVGQPRQEILNEVSIDLPVADVDHSALRERIDAEARHSFDLTGELPVRLALLRVDPLDHVLVVLIHHIASDGWSMAPLSRDVSTAYRARLAGHEPNWSPLPVQYADYAIWQREVAGDLHARQLEYWRTALEGLPEELPLPLDRPRPAVPSNRGASIKINLDQRTHELMRVLAADTGTSAYMILQATLATLLSKLGAGTDIPLGGITAGRSDDALTDLIGFFVNTQVLRMDLSGTPTFREVLAGVRATDFAAYDHQDVPFDALVELVNPDRSLARHPLFQVMLTARTQADYEFALPRLHVEPMRADLRTAKFDLTFSFAERFTAAGGAAGIDGHVEYATDLFDQATVDRMAGQLTSLLNVLITQPDVPLARMTLVTADELELLASWNDTAVEVPRVSLTELLDVQAQRSPEAEAVVFGDQRLSYSELHARADALAAVLAERGAGPEKIVGVALPRSVDSIVALLATLKTGAAYLPLDVELPGERLRWMLEEAQPVAVVATAGSAVEVPGSTAVVLAEEVSEVATAFCSPSITAMTPAHVTYSSDASGRPQGLVLHHGAIANRLLWMRHEFPLTDQDRVLQKTPATFDASVWEVFWPLIQGATLVIAQPGGHLQELHHHTLTTPLSNLDERLPWNTRAYVLDHHLNPVPIGARGELFLAGTQIALGYLNRPDLTAQRFLPDPYGPPGARMYRTGDIAHWDNTGNLHYHGRIDHQVNIRGSRKAPPAQRQLSAEPRSARQQVLAGLFAAALNLPRIGIHDNFFHHGGHSLLAAQLANTIRTTLGHRVSITTVFQAPTVAQMSDVLDSGTNDEGMQVMLPIRASGTGRPVFLMHPGVGIGWAYTGFAGHLPETPLFAVQARALTDPSHTPQSLDEMAADYLGEIRQIQPHGPYRVAGWSFGGNLAHAVAVRLHELGEQVELLAIIDAYPYAGDPGLRGTWNDASAREWVDRHGSGPSALRAMSDEQLSHLADVLVSNTRLARTHTPGLFDGDVLFFRAQGHQDTAARKPEAWQPFATGELEVHEVAAGHHDMLDSEPLAQIVTVLRAKLT